VHGKAAPSLPAPGDGPALRSPMPPGGAVACAAPSSNLPPASGHGSVCCPP